MSVCKPAFMMRDDSLTVLVDNATYTVNKSDTRYAKLITLSKQIRAANGNERKYPTLEQWKDAVKIEPPKPVAEVVKTAANVSGQDVAGYEDLIVVNEQTGLVTVNGTLTHNTITSRIANFVGAGLPFQPLVNFLRKILQNPSYKAQVQLLNFLENRSLPITEDGDFLGYKAVRDDYKDIYSGKFDNSPGQTPRMKRSEVDDDNANQCSKGLHVGGLDYVKGYGTLGRDRIIIVKVNPANAVSVPTDYNHQKLLVCEYYVVGDYQGEMQEHLYSSDARPYGEDEDTEGQDDVDFGDWDDDDIVEAVEDDEWNDDEDEDDDSYWGSEDDEDEDDQDAYWPMGR